jgi:hypothetical protein
MIGMSPAKLRWVVVDDDHSFLEQVKRWFLISCSDFEVLPFANSVDAVDCLRKQRVDLIVTAYPVPAIDGLQLISIVRGVQRPRANLHDLQPANPGSGTRPRRPRSSQRQRFGLSSPVCSLNCARGWIQLPPRGRLTISAESVTPRL